MLRKLIRSTSGLYGRRPGFGRPYGPPRTVSGIQGDAKPMPRILCNRFPILQGFVRHLRAVIGHTRFEADDVIGTLSRKATEEGLQTSS